MNLRAVVAAGILALVPAAAPAEDPAPERFTLRLAPSPDRPVRFVHSSETVQESKAIGRVTAQYEIETALRVLRAVPGGGFAAEFSMGRGSTRMENPALGNLDYETTKALPEKQVLRLMAYAVASLADTSLPVELDAGGRVHRVDGIDRARAAREAALSPSPLEKMMIHMTLTSHNLARLVDGMLVATPLPTESIAVGHRWEDEDPVYGVSRQFDMRIRQTLRIESLDAKEAAVRGEGKILVKAGESLPGAKSLEVQPSEGPVTTTLRLSRADGLPIDVEMRSSVTIGTRVGPIEQTTVSRLRRVEEWPSRGAADGKPRDRSGPVPTSPEGGEGK
ncbi:MAG TPA: DUF6263 family protein [Planctomycetota bacterium]|nr:DUF6263 family protein [Planctomycetota bacterium]